MQIREGSKLGLCKYSIKESMKNGAAIRSEKQKKIVLQYTLDGKFIAEYPCSKSASEIYNCNYKNINRAARGAINSYVGYIWKYKEGE